MLKLYYYECCQFCSRVRIMLEACGFDYTLKILKYDDKETTQKLAQTNLTPILTLEDGRSMPESMSIVDYLQQKSGCDLDEKTLPPEIVDALESTAEVRTNLFIPRLLGLNLEEFSTDSAQQYYYKRWGLTPADIKKQLEKTDDYLQELQPYLQKIVAALQSENFVYDKLSIADIELASVLRNLSCVKGLVFPGMLKSYIDYHSKQSKIAMLPQV